MDLHLKGKNALITGGSRGIGFSTAEALAQEGCNVALCARDQASVDSAVARVAAHGVKAFGRSVDVADADALASWVDDAAEELTGVDIVIANVSALGSGEGEEQWKRAVDIDLMHTVRLVDTALPYLKESDAASIILVSSVSARRPFGATAYGTLKAALNHYGKGLAVEHARSGIRANVVSPGTIYIEDGFWGNIERNNPTMFERSLKSNPMGRMGTPEEVARSIVFLASPASSFTTGTNLLVDGAITPGVQT
ncbi:MAG: SDR family oxidoreductase [Gemmatimonadota bacterium]|nr:SDR family oxidoreductase [Gemmatimonadota bacterium]MDH3422121.1 SDR family oxidoreductase [Gemmatimonadota bacterium]